MDDLYQILRTDQNNRLMLVLEALIVVLFVIKWYVVLWGLET